MSKHLWVLMIDGELIRARVDERDNIAMACESDVSIFTTHGQEDMFYSFLFEGGAKAGDKVECGVGFDGFEAWIGWVDSTPDEEIARRFDMEVLYYVEQ